MSGEAGDLGDEIRRIADETLRLARGGPHEAAVTEAARRIDEPLRVAIAGRTKAGKSTLLNALVGERLAATDAGECTRVVTWYRHGISYGVTAALRPSGRADLPFRRRDGALEIDLDGKSIDEIERIDVSWPSSRLAELTLIDTPGLGSADERTSERTMEALIDDDANGPGQADAVIYLMRHLHRHDSQFLEAFLDHSLAHASPINAIVVLSRADEIGAARLDALDSAAAVARRYAADRRIRELASAVVPVAGLIAETGATLREGQMAWLRTLAAVPPERREALLQSVDRFRDPDLNPLGAEIREELLGGLGLYGLRLAVGLIADGTIRTATDLSGALLEVSGIRALQDLLGRQFAGRADTLKARSALASFRAVADELHRAGLPGAGELAASIERLEAGSGQLALLRLLHLVLAGLVDLGGERQAEIDRLTGTGTPGDRVGVDTEARPADVRAAALAAIERWRLLASSPLSDRRTIEAAGIVIRAYEQLYAASAG